MTHVTFTRTPSYGQPNRRVRNFGINALTQRINLARQRKQLAQLDTSRLADIGISARQANAEANRRFWDAPTWWRLN